MDLLARREHSRLELEQKLTARDFSADLVAEVLDELERDGLLSDLRFARSFVAARAARGHGPFRIRRDLADRGIAGSAEFLNDPEIDWKARAAEVRVRRFGPARPADMKEKARQMRFLEYRGFGHDEIRFALEFHGDSD